MVTFPNTDLPDILEIRNASQSYDGGKTNILQDFNLLIEDKPNQGQFIVILGPSGCGKSTVLRYLAGLQTPTTGEIFIREKLRTEQDRIGMVFQQYSSFPWMTVLENVALGLKYKGVEKKERTEKAMEMIKIVGLEGHHKKICPISNIIWWTATKGCYSTFSFTGKPRDYSLWMSRLEHWIQTPDLKCRIS